MTWDLHPRLHSYRATQPHASVWSESAQLLVGSVTMCPGHITLNGPQLCVTGFWGLCCDRPVGAAGLHVVDHHQLPAGLCSLRARQQACASPDPTLNEGRGKQDPKRTRETCPVLCLSLRGPSPQKGRRGAQTSGPESLAHQVPQMSSTGWPLRECPACRTLKDVKTAERVPSADLLMQRVSETSASAGVCGTSTPILQASGMAQSLPFPQNVIRCSTSTHLALLLHAPLITFRGTRVRARPGTEPALSGCTFRNPEVVAGRACVRTSPGYQ